MFDFLDPFQVVLTEWKLQLQIVCLLASAGIFFVYVPFMKPYISAALVVLAAGLASYERGFHDRGVLDNSQAIQAELEDVKKQLTATQTVAKSAAAREQESALLAGTLQEQIDVYTDKLSKVPQDDRCSLTSDDVLMFRRIDRQNAPSPGATAPVRKDSPRP